MREKRTKLAGHTAVNIIIIALIVLLNCVMFKSDAVAVLSSGVRYRTDEKSSIAMECILAWESENLPDILQVLRENDACITFAVTGDMAKNAPDSISRIASDGHNFLTMGMNYDDAQKLSQDSLTKSIQESCALIEKCGAKVVGFYNMSDDTRKAAKSAKDAGLACMRCTNDLLCARGSADDIKERAKIYAHGGSIIAVTPTAALVEALPEMLKTYRSTGLYVTGVQG